MIVARNDVRQRPARPQKSPYCPSLPIICAFVRTRRATSVAVRRASILRPSLAGEADRTCDPPGRLVFALEPLPRV